MKKKEKIHRMTISIKQVRSVHEWAGRRVTEGNYTLCTYVIIDNKMGKAPYKGCFNTKGNAWKLPPFPFLEIVPYSRVVFPCLNQGLMVD